MTAGAARDAVDPRRLLATATALLEVPSPTGEAGAAADRLAELLRPTASPWSVWPPAIRMPRP